MSLFQKVLASVGVGSAQVDTVLVNKKYTPGREVEGEIRIKGGNIDQEIEAIYLQVHASYTKNVDEKEYDANAVVHKVRISEPLIVEPNSEEVIPFSFRLPNDTPFTMGKTRVWISTGLDIKHAIDPNDKDYIRVTPTPLMEEAINAVKELGFFLHTVECIHASYKHRNRLPFIQELVFKPSSGPYNGKLEDLEIMVVSIEEHLAELILQVDRKARGISGLFAEALDLDEKYISLTISSNDISTIKGKLQSVIDKNI